VSRPLVFPPEFVDAIARRAAELVREQLERPDDWLDVDQAAAYLGRSAGTLRNLVSEGRLPRHGPKGHRLRFRRSELDDYQGGRR
jgi:excisionase family DNA binding protein